MKNIGLAVKLNKYLIFLFSGAATTFSPFHPDIAFSTRPSSTLSLCPALNVRDQINAHEKYNHYKTLFKLEYILKNAVF
jgi:hypothetical protein